MVERIHPMLLKATPKKLILYQSRQSTWILNNDLGLSKIALRNMKRRGKIIHSECLTNNTMDAFLDKELRKKR